MTMNNRRGTGTFHILSLCMLMDVAGSGFSRLSFEEVEVIFPFLNLSVR